MLRGNLLGCLPGHDVLKLSGRFALEVRNPRIVHGISEGNGERFHQRDLASRVFELAIGAHGKCNFLVLHPRDRVKGDKDKELRL
jgi:hypothetical protein